MTDTITGSTTDSVRTSQPATDARQGSMGPWPLSWNDVRLAAMVAVAMFLTVVGAGFGITSLADTRLGELDASVNLWFAERRTPQWNMLSDWGSALSDTITIVLALAILIPLLALITRRWVAPVLLAGAVALETLVFVTASFVVGRDRPPVEQLDVSPPTASFPSGHVGAAVAFYIGVVILVHWWTVNRLVRAAAIVLGGLAPIAVAISRMYRGMHYPTDVVFGALVGAVSVALLASLVRPQVARDEEPEQEEQQVAQEGAVV